MDKIQEHTLVFVSFKTDQFPEGCDNSFDTYIRVPYTLEHFKALSYEQKEAICTAKLIDCGIIAYGVTINRVISDQPSKESTLDNYISENNIDEAEELLEVIDNIEVKKGFIDKIVRMGRQDAKYAKKLLELYGNTKDQCILEHFNKIYTIDRKDVDYAMRFFNLYQTTTETYFLERFMEIYDVEDTIFHDITDRLKEILRPKSYYTNTQELKRKLIYDITRLDKDDALFAAQLLAFYDFSEEYVLLNRFIEIYNNEDDGFDSLKTRFKEMINLKKWEWMELMQKHSEFFTKVIGITMEEANDDASNNVSEIPSVNDFDDDNMFDDVDGDFFNGDDNKE